MTLNKQFLNLFFYIIGPMEGNRLAIQDFMYVEKSLVDAGISIEQIANPCTQEKEKTGYDVNDSTDYILNLRLTGKNEQVDKTYKAIWRVDYENVRKADILIANISPGTNYVGTTREATVASTIYGLDLIRDNFNEEQKKIYEEQVRPGLKMLGFFNKPIYLVTTAKTRINGTMVHGLIRPSGGQCFPNMAQLIEHLKETYK